MKKIFSTFMLVLTALITLSHHIKAPPKKKKNKKNKVTNNQIVEEKLIKKEQEEKKIEENKMHQTEKKKQIIKIEEMEDITTNDKFSQKNNALSTNKNTSLIKEMKAQGAEKIQSPCEDSSFSEKTHYNKYCEYFDIFRVFHHYNTADSLGPFITKTLESTSTFSSPIFIRHEKQNIFFAVNKKNLSKEENEKRNKEFLNFFNYNRFSNYQYLENLNKKYLVGFHKKGCTFDFLKPSLLFVFDNIPWELFWDNFKSKEYYIDFDSKVFQNADPDNLLPSEIDIKHKESIAGLMNIFLKFLEIFVNDGEECLLKKVEKNQDDYEILKKKIADLDVMRTLYLALHSQFLSLDLNNEEDVEADLNNGEDKKVKCKDEKCKDEEKCAKCKNIIANIIAKKLYKKEKKYERRSKKIINLLRKKTQKALTVKEYKYFQSFLMQNVLFSHSYLVNRGFCNKYSNVYSKDILYINVIKEMEKRLPYGVSPIFQIIALKAYSVFFFTKDYLLNLHKPIESIYFNLEKNINFPFENVKNKTNFKSESNWEDIEDSNGNPIFDKYMFIVDKNFEEKEDYEQIDIEPYYKQDPEFCNKKYTALPIGKKTMNEAYCLKDLPILHFRTNAREQIKINVERLIFSLPSLRSQSRDEIFNKIGKECSIYKDLFLWINLLTNNLGHGKKLPLKAFLKNYRLIKSLSERYMLIVNLVEKKNLNSFIMFKIFSYINNKNFSLCLENFDNNWTPERFLKENKFLYFLDKAYKTLLYLPIDDYFYIKAIQSTEIFYFFTMISFDDFYCSHFGQGNENRYWKEIAKNRLLELTKKNN